MALVRAQNHWLGEIAVRGGFVRFTMETNSKNPTMKDVNSIYGLKPIYNTFYIYVHSFVLP